LADFSARSVTALRTSAMRTLGAYANVFAIESFIDELAHRAKADPVEYRLRYLKDERARAVLQKTADMLGWSKQEKKVPGRGRGIAFARYKGLASFCAVALEVEVDRNSGAIRVLRAVSANDAGEVVAPDGVKNQIEGGLVQSLSWTMKEAVRFDAAGVKTADWVSYPILTFSEVPPITVELIDRPGMPFLGAGEAFNWPVAINIIRRIIPREAQGLAKGIFNSGMTFGAVLTPLMVLGLVGPHGEGWRQLFMLTGAAGAIWVVLWLWGTRGARGAEIALPAPQAVNEAVVIPFREIFLLRIFWITMAVGLAVNISWHFYRVWLPRHLVVDLHFTDQQLQYLLIAFYLTADVGSIAIGYIARRLVTPERSIERTRKLVVLAAAGLCLLATPVAFIPSRTLLVPLYCLVGAGLMGVFAMFYAFVQDIPPGHTSKCLGLIGATAWLLNSQLHPLVGRYADTHAHAMGKFAPMILVAGILPLLAALFALTWPESRRGERPAH
jgi:MFS family permease